MIKLARIQFLIVALIGGTIFGLAGCSGGSTTTTNTTTTNKNGTTTTTTNTTTTTTTNSNNTNEKAANTSTASTDDKIGVAECDEYIEKYEACINSKVPEAQRSMLKTPFEQQRAAFKKAAETVQGKATLSASCKQAINVAKQSTAAWGCAW